MRRPPRRSFRRTATSRPVTRLTRRGPPPPSPPLRSGGGTTRSRASARRAAVDRRAHLARLLVGGLREEPSRGATTGQCASARARARRPPRASATSRSDGREVSTHVRHFRPPGLPRHGRRPPVGRRTRTTSGSSSTSESPRRRQGSRCCPHAAAAGLMQQAQAPGRPRDAAGGGRRGGERREHVLDALRVGLAAAAEHRVGGT